MSALKLPSPARLRECPVSVVGRKAAVTSGDIWEYAFGDDQALIDRQGIERKGFRIRPLDLFICTPSIMPSALAVEVVVGGNVGFDFASCGLCDQNGPVFHAEPFQGGDVVFQEQSGLILDVFADGGVDDAVIRVPRQALCKVRCGKREGGAVPEAQVRQGLRCTFRCQCNPLHAGS